MSIYTIYRGCIWLPIVVPALFVVLVTTLGRNPAGLVGEVLGYSLLYGGVPYVGLALWGTGWVGGRPEAEIRRLMFLAPLIMVVVFVLVALVTGVIVGATGPFAAVAVLGLILIPPLGYAYVGLTVLLRRSLGPRIV